MKVLRMVDIHSNATRLLPKPMLPNVAKTTRMIIRKQKRTSTWVDLSSCGRFGNCIKIRNSHGCALRDPSDPAGMDQGRLRSAAALGKMAKTSFENEVEQGLEKYGFHKC
jgi:hypothetical protein